MSYSIGTELDETAFCWPTPTPTQHDWPSDIWPQNTATHLDSGSTPRCVRQDLTGTGLALAQSSSIGPLESRRRDDGIATFGTAPAMARTLSAAGSHGWHSAPTSTQPIYTSSNGNGKRDFDQIDMAHSNSYTFGSVPSSWQTTSTSTLTACQPQVDEVHIYEPADYCSKLSSDFDDEAVQFAAFKKQRVDCFDESQQASQPSYASSMCVPSAHHVSPSTSMSAHLSPPSSLASSEAMSRQSSVTSASVIGAFDMMRVNSSFSIASDLFQVDDLDGSFVSCATEKPAVGSQHTIGIDDSSSTSQLLSNVGYGLVGTDISFTVDQNQNFSEGIVAVGGQQYAHESLQHSLAYEMQRSDSQDSNASNSSADLKASERRRKHIENGKQSIAPKSLPDGPKSSRSTTSETQPSKYIKSEDSTANRKEAISKAPYVRPQHPKLYCNMCEEFPSGFRGEHELRRHWDRAHAECRKVWICTEPTTRTEWWPAKPLGICKQCKQQKQYNVYYNAAAHLRRAHFCPRKRGRKARGEERESRAGKAGGDWPPIDWLKANGWLKEIEVSSDQAFGNVLANTASEDVPFDDDFGVPQQDLVMPHHETSLGLQTYPTADFTCGYPTPIDSTTMQWPAACHVSAPMMEHTMSAPPTFAAMTPMYAGDGFATY